MSVVGPHPGQESCDLCDAWRDPADLVDAAGGERWCREHQDVGCLPPDLAKAVDDAVERMRLDQESAERLLEPYVAARTLELQQRLNLAGVEIRALSQMVDDAQASMQDTARQAHEIAAEVSALQAGWRSAWEMHSRHHWCVDRQERTRPFKIGERCPTLEALESGRAVTP